MEGLAELERTKRRRLQDAYADLRPSGKGDDDRQAKLRNLLLGAAADAGLPAAGGNGTQSVRALAAAAAASITAVGSSPRRSRSPSGRPGTGRRATGDATVAAAAAAAVAAPAQVHGSAAAAAASPFSGSGRRRFPHAAARPPPPGPMDGGFLPEGDPIQRLARLRLPLGGDAMARILRVGTSSPNPTVGLGHNGSCAAAAAAQRYDGYEDDDDDGDIDLGIPSDVELALTALKSDLRSHPASANLPPLVLRSQLSYLLTDRSTVERQLDEQRRANRVRVFKLPTGVDEFGVLTTADYRTAVRQVADSVAAEAAQQQHSAAGTQPPSSSSGAYVSPAACGSSSNSSSQWHAAAEAFLCRVVNRCTEFQLPRDHMVHLMQTAPPPPPGRQPPQLSRLPRLQSQHQQQQQEQQQQQQQGLGNPRGAAAAAAAVSVAAGIPPEATPEATPRTTEAAEEQISLLLHLGCIARHTDGDADAYVLAVPGAGKLVKSVLGGRRELLTWLSKRQHCEAPEEQVCKLKLRSSCLPNAYHVQDLVGCGAVARLDSTVGPIIRLPRRRGAVAGMQAPPGGTM